MGTKTQKFITFIVITLAVVFFCYQIYSAVYKPITTATAVSYNTFDGTDITGFFVKNEEIINERSDGAVRYVTGDGEKVSKGGVIAEIYSGAQEASNKTQTEELQKQITTLEAINSVSDPSSVDLDTLNNKIMAQYVEFLDNTESGKYFKAAQSTDALLTNMNKKQIVTGEVEGFDTLLSSMKLRLKSLQASQVDPLSTIVASKSGFFVSSVDGLESVLNTQNIDNINESVYDSVSKYEKTESSFGKIVSDNDWYIVTKMDNDDYLNFSVGNSVELKSSIAGCEYLGAEVYKVNISKDKNSAIVIFKCSVMNGEIASTRSAPLTIVNESYEGIRVSSKSVRVVGGVTGVYVIQGSIVKFKPIEIIYKGDNFVICKKNDNSDSSKLRLYDEVIEKGKNLYDGKYIN